MDSIDEISKNNSNKKGFFKHVFNFDEESKEEMCNIVQYALLALIPIIILNKAIQRLVPEADEEKGNVEILAEVIMQVIVMFLGILIIHRIITFIPTYSGVKYADFSVTNIILAVLLIILSLQTKLGEKVSILVDRIMELWDGSGSSDDKKGKDKKKSKGQGQMKVSQPISQTPGLLNQQMNSQSTSLSLLPPPQLVSNPTNTNSSNDFSSNNSFQESVPSSMYEGFAPMAANEALGGGTGFGASNW